MKKGDKIFMRFPMSAAYIMPARLAISGVATRLGMGIDDLEDLRAAVSEACVWAMDGMESGFFDVSAEIADELLVSIAVEGERSRPRDENGDVLEISRMMTESMCSKSEFLPHGVKLWFAL